MLNNNKRVLSMIIFCTHVLPSSNGGVATSCRRWLLSAEELGAQTAWIFSSGSTAQLYQGGVLVQTFDGPARDKIEQLKILLPHARMVVIHYFGLATELGYQLSMSMMIPLVINFRGNDAVFESFSPNFSNANVIGHAKHLVFVAEHLMRLLEGKFGDLSHKSTIVHNWLTKRELLNCSPEKDHDSSRIVFGATGMWKWKKGLIVVLRMLQDHPELIDDFLIAGDISQISDEEQLRLSCLHNAGLPEVKRYEYDNSLSFYRKIDVLVVPSLGEGSPNVIYEAAANGCFIIGSEVPGVKEILERFNIGSTFEPGNAEDLHEVLETIRKNPEQVRQTWNDRQRTCLQQAKNPWIHLQDSVIKY